MANNHGDRKSPIPGDILFQMAFFWHISGGGSNYLLNGMILQVNHGHGFSVQTVRFHHIPKKGWVPVQDPQSYLDSFTKFVHSMCICVHVYFLDFTYGNGN